MAVEKYTALANITLTSTASSVTFGSIPSGYRDLRLVYRGTTTASSGVFCRANSDSGSNYSLVRMGGNGSTTFSSSTTTTYFPMLYSGDPVTGLAILQILDYSATDKHKTALSRGGGDYGIVEAVASRWANTAAITSLVITNTSTTFAIGTTFELYGVK